MAEPEEYDAEWIDDKVVRLPLPLPLPDLPLVNCYAIVGSDGLTLIDPGWKSEATERALLSHLSTTLDAGPAEVRRILVTHAHWDHYSHALDWSERHGTEVMLGKGEQKSIERLDLSKGSFPAQVELLRGAGAAELAEAIATLPLEEHEVDIPFGPPGRWLKDGDEIDCGGRTVTAIATPGHTRGHMVYALDGLQFTGDHVLPRITPALAFEQEPQRQPLASYLSSLRLHLDGPDHRLLPAHGRVTPSVRLRARELLAHHDQRLAQVLDLVAGGKSTAYEAAEAMRWTRRAKTLDQLGPVHAMTAVLEVRAHLEFLVDRGDLAKHHDVVESYAAA